MMQWDYRILEEAEVEELLLEAKLCRMAMAAESQPYLLPMAVQTQKDGEGSLVFRMESPLYGTKMEYLQLSRRVALEFERTKGEETDSVLVFGIARFHLPKDGGGRAEIKITPYQISGRRHFGK